MGEKLGLGAPLFSALSRFDLVLWGPCQMACLDRAAQAGPRRPPRYGGDENPRTPILPAIFRPPPAAKTPGSRSFAIPPKPTGPSEKQIFADSVHGTWAGIAQWRNGRFSLAQTSSRSEQCLNTPWGRSGLGSGGQGFAGGKKKKDRGPGKICWLFGKQTKRGLLLITSRR